LFAWNPGGWVDRVFHGSNLSNIDSIAVLPFENLTNEIRRLNISRMESQRASSTAFPNCQTYR